ncbi:MAG: hypothetical protein JSS61_03410 [Verrucomicrobia bacterium]|nr:hypothetical protein [Verrucomicrobiota bacterium]
MKKLLCALLLAASLGYFYKRSGEFHPRQIVSETLRTDRFPIPENLDEVRALLMQPFWLFDAGGDCYVFLSDEGSHVLKVFKHHKMREHAWYDRFFPELATKRHARLKHLFSSAEIAYTQFKEETGLCFLQLGKSDHFHTQIELIDKKGKSHFIDPNTLDFALQKRAKLVYPHLESLKDVETAKRCIDSLLQLMLTRSAKGIGDRDPILSRNFGFIEERAVEIDIGSFVLEDSLRDPLIAKHLLVAEAARLSSWLKKHIPALRPHLEDRLLSWGAIEPMPVGSKELKAQLTQPYRFVSKTPHCTTYASEDGKYLLHLLKHPQGSLASHLRACGVEEMGILYMQLHRMPYKLPRIEVPTRFGRKKKVNLSHARFVLQKRECENAFRSLLLASTDS